MNTQKLENDTAVFHAMRYDHSRGVNVWVGKIGTRDAIVEAELQVDESYILYCPHEWIENGWVRYRP